MCVGSESRPGGQTAQVVDPGEVAIWPFAQVWQEPAPETCMYVPVGQGVQLVAPADENVPG